MILTRGPEGLLVVLQTDHGDQTGLLASSWGNEEVAPVAFHRAPAQLAARHHDNGWASWEREPTLDPATGQPYQFLALPPREHLPLYREGIARAVQMDPWAGLLVSMHGSGLYNDRYGTFRLAERTFCTGEQVLVDEFLRDMERLQDGLFAPYRHQAPGYGAPGHGAPGHAADDAEVRHLYLLLQVWDRLSLQFAYRLASDGDIAPLPPGVTRDGTAKATSALRCRSDGSFALRLDPYPFVEDGLAFPVAARRVPDRRYRSPEDFLETLAGTAPITLDCRVRADRH